jgi:hypothetical protein
LQLRSKEVARPGQVTGAALVPRLATRLSSNVLRCTPADKSSSSVKLHDIYRHNGCFMLIVRTRDEMVTKHEIVDSSLLKAPVRVVRSLHNRLAASIERSVHKHPNASARLERR